MVNGRMLKEGVNNPNAVEGSHSSTTASSNRNIHMKKEEPMVSAFSGTRVTVNIQKAANFYMKNPLSATMEIGVIENPSANIFMQICSNPSSHHLF